MAIEAAHPAARMAMKNRFLVLFVAINPLICQPARTANISSPKPINVWLFIARMRRFSKALLQFAWKRTHRTRRSERCENYALISKQTRAVAIQSTLHSPPVDRRMSVDHPISCEQIHGAHSGSPANLPRNIGVLDDTFHALR